MGDGQYSRVLLPARCLSSTQVDVSTSTSGTYTKCTFRNTEQLTYQFGDGGVAYLNCGAEDATGKGITGRYLRVMNVGASKVLSLCEVQVFGSPDPCNPKQRTSRLARVCPEADQFEAW
eukprot:TRINITY_DN3242_c0_g1_i1.p1 TRINITY_DN3242_c0_g1~~TRINITY_DN3242_c0_g1_i1.p1  ORF type:complete len:119 (+),score=9.05 TRINITY_DN3242_c0_g1_i1:235-591(+)